MCRISSRLYNFSLRILIDSEIVIIHRFLTNCLNRIIKKSFLMDLLTI
nr:MAG TPA_asm: hypothetical protein [Caudoviricetes sp.]